MKDGSLLSVIVPVYNGGSYLNACLESLSCQTYSSLEFIIVNDGSTDGSQKVIEHFCERDSRFRLISQANAGVSTARNHGIDAAKGDWISFIDCDDWIEPNTYSDLMEQICTNQADAAMFSYSVDYVGQQPQEHRFKKDVCGVIGNEQAMELIYRVAPFSVTKVYSRAIIGDTRYHIDIFRGEDTIFAIEAIKNAQRIVCTDTPYYHYVQSEGSAARGKITARQLTGSVALKWMLDFADEFYPKLHNSGVNGYVNIMIELGYDIFYFRFEDKSILKAWKLECKKYRKEVYAINGRRSVLGLKTFLYCLSPRLFYFVMLTFRKIKHGQ